VFPIVPINISYENYWYDSSPFISLFNYSKGEIKKNTAKTFPIYPKISYVSIDDVILFKIFIKFFKFIVIIYLLITNFHNKIILEIHNLF
jgi:hypothetical protein